MDMDTNEICMLCQFPDEVKLNIWNRLQSIDIVNIEKGLQCNCTRNMSYDKLVISKLSFWAQYGLQFQDFRDFMRPRSDLITHLNINCSYWLPKALITSCITKMKSLKCLNAADTKLLYEDLVKIKGQTNIEEIYVSSYAPEKCDLTDSSFKVIHILYYRFEIDSESIRKILNYNHHIRKKILLIKGNGIGLGMSSPREELPGRGNSQIVQLCIPAYERNPDDQRLEYNRVRFQVSSCRVFHIDTMFDTFDKTGYVNRNDAHYPYLACSTSCCACGNKYIRDVMDDANMYCLNYCLVESDSKRCCSCSRHEAPNLVSFKQTLKSLRNAEILHIWSCQKSLNMNVKLLEKNLESISTLKKLKGLTVDRFPRGFSGKFLKTVLTSCTALETLKLKLNDHVPSFSNVLNALENCSSLKELYLDYDYNLDLNRLLRTLKQCPSKLVRFVIHAKTVKGLDSNELHDYLSANPQLRFVYFMIPGMSKAVIGRFQKKFDYFAGANPQNIYKIGQALVKFDYKNRHRIPLLYVLEVLLFGWLRLDKLLINALAFGVETKF